LREKRVQERDQRTKVTKTKGKRKVSQEFPREFMAKLLYSWGKRRYKKEKEKR